MFRTPPTSIPHPDILAVLTIYVLCLMVPVFGQTDETENVRIRTRIDGTIYGARPDDTGPIGGGPGYKRLIPSADTTVKTLDQLINALEHAEKGDVIYVPGDVTIDCTVRVYIEELVLKIPGGVTLASNRGHNGSHGALIKSDTFDTNPLLRATGPDVRITGLRIRGPDPNRRMRHHRPQQCLRTNGSDRAITFATSAFHQ